MTGRLIELIRRLKRGDKNGFEEFYRLTKSAVWYVISRKLFDRQKAEDVMQETYVKFLNSLQKVDEEGNPMAYLLTIAKNKSLDEYKKNAKEQLSDEMEEHGGRADFYSPLAAFVPVQRKARRRGIRTARTHRCVRLQAGGGCENTRKARFHRKQAIPLRSEES